MQLDKIWIIKGKTRKYFYSQEDMERVKELLARYLKGERISFKMRLRLDAFSPFTRRVLRIVRTIPYGETRSYGWAGKIGLAEASRVRYMVKRRLRKFEDFIDKVTEYSFNSGRREIRYISGILTTRL